MKLCKECNDYHDLWKNNQIYCEDIDDCYKKDNLSNNVEI